MQIYITVIILLFYDCKASNIKNTELNEYTWQNFKNKIQPRQGNGLTVCLYFPQTYHQ